MISGENSDYGDLEGGEGTPGTTGSGWTIDLAPLSGTIEEDLERRDFTIDAMAIPLADWETGVFGDSVIDPLNGRQDLVNKSIRAIHAGVFREDPGRLMRAVRLAGQTAVPYHARNRQNGPRQRSFDIDGFR